MLVPFALVLSLPSDAAPSRGPLPRWRLGPDGENATPSPRPDQSPTPRRVDRTALRQAPGACTLESPPEYAAMDGILLRYRSGEWSDVTTALVASLTAPGHDEIAYVVVSDASQQSSATTAFNAAGADMAKVQFIVLPTDSIWLRDYGPHFIKQGGADAVVDSHYYIGRSQDNFIPTLLADDYFVDPSYDIGLYYSGGNFQASADRQGFVTALINADNPGFGEPFIASLYDAYQGIDTLHVLPQLPGSVDGTGHIDMWFYLVDEDSVIISEFLPGSNQAAIDITNNAVPYMQGLGYEVIRVPAFNATHPGHGTAHYTYTNAFRVNDRIFIPTYGQGNPAYVQHDTAALAAWQQAAGPGVTIVPINSYDIIWAAGAIHCIVMQVPRTTDPLPAACVTSPAGGDVLVPGASHEITWTSSDDGTVSAVDLYYSLDGGLTYPPSQVIATGLADDGSHLWTVPQAESPSTRIKVVATDDDANQVEAESSSDLALESALRHVYDFGTGAGVDRFGWGNQTSNWTTLNGVRRPVAVGTALTSTDYSRLATSNATGGDTDVNRYISLSPSPVAESTHIFEFTITEDPAKMVDLEVRWEGYADDCAQMELYVWDYVASQWCDGNGNCGENRFMDNFAGNRDGNLRAHIRSGFDRYVNATNKLTLLLYTERNFFRSFHDYLSVTVSHDPCAGPDLDFDGFANGCDNCQAVVNPAQTNGDGDVRGDACDCAASNASVFAVPSEILNVALLDDKTTLTWDSDAANSGSGTKYDVMRGTIAQLPVGGGAAETCAANESTGTTLTGLATPAAGTGHYYLVRGGNSCGTGGYGTESDGGPRAGVACP